MDLPVMKIHEMCALLKISTSQFGLFSSCCHTAVCKGQVMDALLFGYLITFFSHCIFQGGSTSLFLFQIY